MRFTENMDVKVGKDMEKGTKIGRDGHARYAERRIAERYKEG